MSLVPERENEHKELSPQDSSEDLGNCKCGAGLIECSGHLGIMPKKDRLKFGLKFRDKVMVCKVCGKIFFRKDRQKCNAVICSQTLSLKPFCPNTE